MRKLLFAAIAAIGLSGPAEAASPGIYQCVTHRLVGMQYARDKRAGEDPTAVPREYGKLEPRVPAFTVEISEIFDEARTACDVIGPMPTEFIYCKSGSYLARAQLGESKGGLDRIYYSHSGSMFIGDFGTFWLTVDGLYTLVRLDPGAKVLEEGRCTMFIRPID
jgi:hypothetical protein